jgi:hypothetical protein
VVALLVHERSLVVSSLRTADHLKWIWLLLAVELESASMASLARVQRRLLGAGTARIKLLPVLATVYAGNALSATLPVAGSQMGTMFSFRRFKQLGADPSVAGWTLVVAGLVSSLASATLLAVGAMLTGNDVVAATGAAGAAVGLGLFVLATVAIRRPAVLARLLPRVGWVLRVICRVLDRPFKDPEAVVTGLIARLRSLRLSTWDWVAVVIGAVVNWLADAGVLAASIVAVGGHVPWKGLLFAYGLGSAASTVGIIPGGLGVVEGALAAGLMGVGVRHPLALAAVLVYRLVSFWLVISVGWLAYLFAGRRAAAGRVLWLGPARGARPSRSHLRGEVDLHLPASVPDIEPGEGAGRPLQLGEEHIPRKRERGPMAGAVETPGRLVELEQAALMGADS